MIDVSVSELRRLLPEYLTRAARGTPVRVTRRGRVIAVIVPPGEVRAGAREALARLRRQAVIGDVESPIDTRWAADDRP
jgi:prevent-host-death family protein